MVYHKINEIYATSIASHSTSELIGLIKIFRPSSEGKIASLGNWKGYPDDFCLQSLAVSIFPSRENPILKV